MNTTTQCIEVCQSLLRGERSAVETYNQAIEKYAHEPRSVELRKIRDEHKHAVNLLEENIRQMGDRPGTDSGAWGSFTHFVQGTANLFGRDSAVESLQTGEKKGKGDYEDALENEEVLPECKTLIRTELLPRVCRHIGELEQIQNAS